jgi:hypothetical protein
MTRLVFPVLLGAVVIVVVTAAIRLRGRRRAAFLRESAIVLTAYFVYFLIRGATEGRAAEAIARAQSLESLESKLCLLVEVRLQEALLGVRGVLEAANGIYIWWHWPVIGVAGLWLYLTRQDRYRVYRNTMLVSGAIGVVIFALFPTAPPRLADPAIIDTVVEHSQVYRVMQPPPLTNQYAAIPSLHFGWNLLIGIALFRESRVPVVRAFGLISPPLMLLATVVTGNHYVLDTIAGGTLVLVSLWLVERASSGATEPEAPLESVDDATAVKSETSAERLPEPPPSGTRRR